MFNNLKESLHNIVDRVEDLGLSTMEFYKLRLFKSAMKGVTSLVNLLVFGSLSLFVMLFLSVGVALWLGTLFVEAYIGFLIVGGFYALALICMFIFGKKMIEKSIIFKSSRLFYDEDDLEPQERARRELDEFSAVLRKEEWKENEKLSK